MKNKLINVYGILAFLVLAAAIIWFGLSVTAETRKGVLDAERTFGWISRESTAASISDGFMSDSFIQKLTAMCRQSRLLSALVLSTPSGTVFAWPDHSPSIKYDMQGNPQIPDTSLFMKVYSTNLDIGEGANGTVVMTAVLYVLHPDSIFSASRNSFLIILAILLTTFIVIIAVSPSRKGTNAPHARQASGEIRKDEFFDDTAFTLPQLESADSPTESFPDTEYPADSFDSGTVDFSGDEPPYYPVEDFDANKPSFESADSSVPLPGAGENAPSGKPEGLFSPITGIGWEQYLSDRLEAELVRAASSEQDLSLIVLRISGLLHTDILSRKISKVLLDTFKFRDMVFEFGSNGFAGILQNINLDQAMKIADTLYAGIDSILMEMSHEGQITVGITTRTARLLPAARMIEEAVSAAKKAEEEPSLPIVAFRANPDKYRNYVAENN